MRQGSTCHATPGSPHRFVQQFAFRPAPWAYQAGSRSGKGKMPRVVLAREQMAALERYLNETVEPTFEDFKRNPSSARHAYLACVAAYHAVDRASYPRSPGNLRDRWRKRSFEFTVVDMVAHKFKHVISGDEKAPTKPGHIPLPQLVFGRGTLNSYGFNTDSAWRWWNRLPQSSLHYSRGH